MEYKLCETFVDFLLYAENNGSKIAGMIRNEQFLIEPLPISYICISEENPYYLSYLTEDRLNNLTDDEIWQGGVNSKRFHGKPAKVARKLLDFDKAGIVDSDCETFTNMLRAYSTANGNGNGNEPKYTFKRVYGESIRNWYHESRYSTKYGSEASGSPWKSCMRECQHQKYLDIFVRNDVGMLVLLDEEEQLLGRALLWKARSSDGEEYKVMDRIYACKAELSVLFKDYAKRNKYIYKTYQSYDNKMEFEIPKGKASETRSKTLFVDLDHSDLSYYPYMDTFTYLDDDNGTLTNDASEPYSKELTSIHGGYDGNDEHYGETYCDWNEEYFCEDSVVYCENGNNCHRDDAIWMEDVQEYAYPETVAVWDDVDEHYIHEDNSVYIESEQLETHIENSVYSDREGQHILSDSAEYCEHDGNYILECNAVWVEELNSYAHEDDVEELLEETEAAAA